VPAGVYIGAASRGGRRLSGSHDRRRARRVRYFNHGTHRSRAGTGVTGVYGNMRYFRIVGWNLVDWVGRIISSALTVRLSFVLEPGKKKQ